MSRDEGYLSPAQCEQFSNRFNIVGAMLKSLVTVAQLLEAGLGFDFSLLRYIFASLLRLS